MEAGSLSNEEGEDDLRPIGMEVGCGCGKWGDQESSASESGHCVKQREREENMLSSRKIERLGREDLFLGAYRVWQCVT